MIGLMSAARGSGASRLDLTRSRRRPILGVVLGSWLAMTTLGSHAQSQAFEPTGTARSGGGAPFRPAQAESRAKLELPLSLHAYTRQVQVATLDWVLHPGFGLSVEFPRWRVAGLSFFPLWRAGFEHHAHLQQRWYIGVAPSLRFDFRPWLAAQLSLGVHGAFLRSLWTPFRFDSRGGTWSRGERDDKWSWLFDVDLTLWLSPSRSWGVGLGYGLGALYPFAKANDAPVLPLTRLGICGRWVVGV